MKRIRVKFCEFGKKDEENKNAYAYFLNKILQKYYKVEISEKPDYLFYGGSSFDYLKYDCIKIFYTGENISPNFNLCDYAIGFDYLTFEDRYFRFPLYLATVFYNEDELSLAGEDYLNKQDVFTKEDLKNKKDFCSFVYSNYLSDDSRRIFFEKLNRYKKVNSGGAYLNNIGYRVVNKLEFELKHKFSIAFENTSRSGYTTEKIVSSLVAKTIPIYWGNPKINKEFNEKRFINCHNYGSFDDVVKRVIEIDKNDSLYVKIINNPLKAENYDFGEVRKNFEIFLRNIIDQPLKSAKRRTENSVIISGLEENEKYLAKFNEKRARKRKMLSKIYQPFKKIKFIENLKYKYFRKNINKNARNET